ncbi:MAG: LLM class F420-dependent oxidoreductase [Deltaproteobacteria bacterium]|nr:LLM class F420-dependent oxidoreductase [Deltaproteobacteria bacterium]MBI2991237.1 LLM class F420-dependent oxidoreductase [Deltaproteobacteria bacterium]
MKFGVFLPISGRAAGPATLAQAARQAETLGYHSVWAADRIVIPWEIKTPYPYSEGQSFIVPPDRPFLEPLTCLAFLAGCTEKVILGISVLVLPYRHPLYWAKIATTIDHLSRGRLILGVGVGWMAEEFAALGVSFKERGDLSDEQLRLLQVLWKEERIRFEGRHYRVDDIAFQPKPLQQPRIPLWVGGEGARAQMRAARYGDAWFPYFVRITPAELARRFENVRRRATENGRDPAEIRLNCCLPLEVTQESVTQEEDRLRGHPGQLAKALAKFRDAGVEHIALQFMVPHWPERQAQIERFAREVLPELK